MFTGCRRIQTRTVCLEKESSRGFKLNWICVCWRSGFENLHSASQLCPKGVLSCDLKGGAGIASCFTRAHDHFITYELKLSVDVHAHIYLPWRDFSWWLRYSRLLITQVKSKQTLTLFSLYASHISDDRHRRQISRAHSDILYQIWTPGFKKRPQEWQT